jgi:hypothetical protein
MKRIAKKEVKVDGSVNFVDQNPVYAQYLSALELRKLRSLTVFPILF